MSNTKTTSFITPILKIPSSFLASNGFLNSYLGYYLKTGDTWGECIYLSFEESKLTEHMVSYLMKHEQFLSSMVDGNTRIFEFRVTESTQDAIVKPFLEGKYSKVDKDYVNNNFPKLTFSNGSMTLNPKWKVFYKHPDWAKYWEQRIGITFNDNMEVWSKPLKQEEIYGFPEQVSELDTESVPEASEQRTGVWGGETNGHTSNGTEEINDTRGLTE